MKVLVLGRQQFIMDKILPMIRAENFEAVGVLTDEETIENLRNGNFDVVAVGGGVESDSREKVRTIANETNTKFLEIFGSQTLLPKLLELKK
ncbi:MAG: hypothetical protein HC846_13810 [Blastocatellia bacterium]|nr:hypothetical protein [Blastocatellia bacterium]